ncbi:helix-turn-helix domain-containing protein [Planobispora rosea]|uniref:helix-turn-helix domain-containing protein n=1 Tax=Planobispora rosea TaxID=35762 RepID=UPI000839FEC1|nr:helix-turn-helix transcriptional regulator [Planobispora rosea]
MARPEKAITRTGPIAEHAHQLRALRASAGLGLRELAEHTGYSTATLSVAASGSSLPSWEVTRAYVVACGGDVKAWRSRWENAAHSVQPARQQAAQKVQGMTEVRYVHGELPAGKVLSQVGGPAPLPVTAESPADFMDCLLRVKIWAGNPSVRTLAARADMPASTLHDFLHHSPSTVPSLDMVITFLGACGIDDAQVVGEWIYTWRRLKFSDEISKRRPDHQRHRFSA